MTAAEVHEGKVDLITVDGNLRYDVRCLTCDWEAPVWHTSSQAADRDLLAHIADMEAQL